MPLNRTQLVTIAEQKYFEACNAGDLETVLGNFAPDCRIRFAAAAFQYVGTEAIKAHFEEFVATFSTIDFRDCRSVVDVEAQTIAVQFEVELIDHDGQGAVMQNCNFFRLDEHGKFSDVMIYNSAPLDQGFEAGSEADSA